MPDIDEFQAQCAYAIQQGVQTALRDIEAAASAPGHTLEQAVAESEAAVREAEAEAAEAERAAEQYSATDSRPAASDDLVSRLDDLAKLREKGVLSQAEFETAKSRMLGG